MIATLLRRAWTYIAAASAFVAALLYARSMRRARDAAQAERDRAEATNEHLRDQADAEDRSRRRRRDGRSVSGADRYDR